MKADSCQPEILIFNPGIFFVNASHKKACRINVLQAFSFCFGHTFVHTLNFIRQMWHLLAQLQTELRIRLFVVPR